MNYRARFSFFCSLQLMWLPPLGEKRKNCKRCALCFLQLWRWTLNCFHRCTQEDLQREQIRSFSQFVHRCRKQQDHVCNRHKSWGERKCCLEQTHHVFINTFNWLNPQLSPASVSRVWTKIHLYCLCHLYSKPVWQAIETSWNIFSVSTLKF